MKLALYVDQSNQGRGQWTLVAMRGRAVSHTPIKGLRWDEVTEAKATARRLLRLERAPRWQRIDATHYKATISEKGRTNR